VSDQRERDNRKILYKNKIATSGFALLAMTARKGQNMPILTERFNLSTKGFTDILDITKQVKQILEKYSPEDAQVMVYVAGSTASITTVEYEPGLLKDIPEAFEIIAPINKTYHHDKTWHDGNGFSHVRASIIGNSKSFPVKNQELVLGTWQQIVLIDFDNKPRTRCVYVQIIY